MKINRAFSVNNIQPFVIVSAILNTIGQEIIDEIRSEILNKVIMFDDVYWLRHQ